MGRHNRPVRRALGGCLIALLGFALQATVVNVAVADDANRSKAVAHYEQGEAYFKAGGFAKAIIEYEKAYALVPRPGLLFNIALAHENNGATGKAIEYFDRYLVAEPNGGRAPEARARVDALKRAQLEDQAKQAKEREIRARADKQIADAKFLAATKTLNELYASTNDPAVLYAIATIYEKAGESARAWEGYTRYLDSGDKKYAAEAAARRSALKRDKAPPAPPVSGPTPLGETRTDSRSIVGPAVASGVTATLLGAGVFFGLRARSIESDLSSQLMDRDPPLNNSDGRLDDGRSAATAANIFFAVGAVGAGVSGYLWYRFLGSEGARTGTAATFVTPTANGFAIGGNF